MTLAIDVSNWWLPGPVSDEQALILMKAARKAGARRVIAGTQIPSVTNQQLVAAGNAGMTVEAYLQIKWDRPFGPQFDEAMYAIGEEPVRRLWLAVEPNYGPPTMEYLRPAVATARYVLGSKVGIYTNANNWVNVLGNPPDFSDLPLWWAQYDYAARINPYEWRRDGFGPWFKPIMKQYHDTVSFAGMNVDLNVY